MRYENTMAVTYTSLDEFIKQTLEDGAIWTEAASIDDQITVRPVVRLAAFPDRIYSDFGYYEYWGTIILSARTANEIRYIRLHTGSASDFSQDAVEFLYSKNEILGQQLQAYLEAAGFIVRPGCLYQINYPKHAPRVEWQGPTGDSDETA